VRYLHQLAMMRPPDGHNSSPNSTEFGQHVLRSREKTQRLSAESEDGCTEHDGAVEHRCALLINYHVLIV
jgi:hypothetical protein